MQNKILKISLTISILGILLLLFISNTIEPKLEKIQSLNFNDLNKKARIQGQIISIKSYDKFQIIKLNDKTGSINILVSKNINLTKNQTITIYGKLIEYNNALEIQADKILQS